MEITGWYTGLALGLGLGLGVGVGVGVSDTEAVTLLVSLGEGKGEAEGLSLSCDHTTPTRQAITTPVQMREGSGSIPVFLGAVHPGGFRGNRKAINYLGFIYTYVNFLGFKSNSSPRHIGLKCVYCTPIPPPCPPHAHTLVYKART